MIEVIDNFLNNIDKVRDYAINLEYYSPKEFENWVGFRTKILNYSDDLTIQLKEKIINCFYEKFFYWENILLTSVFHYSPLDSITDKFHQTKFHTDNYVDNFNRVHYAGIIYLTPNPPNSVGTSLVINQEIFNVHNKYNRILIYPSDILHAPENFFGHDLYDSRMTYTFFITLKGY